MVVLVNSGIVAEVSSVLTVVLVGPCWRNWFLMSFTVGGGLQTVLGVPGYSARRQLLGPVVLVAHGAYAGGYICGLA